MKNLAICFTMLLFCSCEIHRRIYSPTQINNPSLRQKNDHSFTLAYSTPSGFDLTGGYAITNRLAVVAGTYLYKNKSQQSAYDPIFGGNYSTASLLYRHKGIHGGFGVYFPLSKKSNSSFCSFFGGYSRGSFRLDEDFFDNSAPPSPPASVHFYKSNIGRYFLQGGFNGYSKDFEVSLLCRYNYVAYSNVITDYTTDQQSNLNFPPLGYSKYSQFFDFAFDGKFFFTNKPEIGLQIFILVTSRMNKKEFNFHYYPVRAGMGVVIKNPFGKK